MKTERKALAISLAIPLAIPKTIKLFINGEFPRTESGRSFAVLRHGSGAVYANLCLASRKDLRNAVTAAGGAQPAWQKRSSYNRAQILYRMAEMFEGKRDEFSEILKQTTGLRAKEIRAAVDQAIEALVYFSGFADKYQQVIGSVNPVSGPHHCFTSPEPVGVVGLICDSQTTLPAFVSSLAAAVSSGNSIVAILPDEIASLAGVLGEVIATSDLPHGVVNLLTGQKSELLSPLASHMEVHSIAYRGKSARELEQIKELASENMKRVNAHTDAPLSLNHLLDFVEYKTVWHPIGL